MIFFNWEKLIFNVESDLIVIRFLIDHFLSGSNRGRFEGLTHEAGVELDRSQIVDRTAREHPNLHRSQVSRLKTICCQL